jgi:hypothetical protein
MESQVFGKKPFSAFFDISLICVSRGAAGFFGVGAEITSSEAAGSLCFLGIVLSS